MNYWQGYQEEYDYRSPRPAFRIGPKLTPVVKILIVVNVAVFVLQVILIRAGVVLTLAGYGDVPVQYLFCLVPRLLMRRLFLWQLGTHMFLHGGPFHVLFNMWALWMCGSQVEARLGSRQFLRFYLLSGVVAGLCSTITSWGSTIPMLGASGAIFGVLAGFAMLFRERRIIVIIFLFPLVIQAKYLALFFLFLSLFLDLMRPVMTVAHFAHLGGLLFGYGYIRKKYGLTLPYAFLDRISSSAKRRWLWRKRPKYRYKPVDAQEFINREVDPILAKISRQGMSSLTRKEKKILKRARSQMK